MQILGETVIFLFSGYLCFHSFFPLFFVWFVCFVSLFSLFFVLLFILIPSFTIKLHCTLMRFAVHIQEIYTTQAEIPKNDVFTLLKKRHSLRTPLKKQFSNHSGNWPAIFRNETCIRCRCFNNINNNQCDCFISRISTIAR